MNDIVNRVCAALFARLVFRYPPDGFWDKFVHKIPGSLGGVESTKSHSTASLSSPMHVAGPSLEASQATPLAASSPAAHVDSSQATPVAAAARAPSEEHNDVFARLFRPKAALCDSCFEVSIDSQHFITFPTTISPADRTPKLWNAALPDSMMTEEATLEEWAKRAAAISDRHEISLFSVVFVMETPSGVDLKSGSAGSESAAFPTEKNDIEMLCDAAKKLSVSLMHEQRRVRYVSQQVQMLQDVKEQAAHPHDTAALTSTQLERCRLAQELAALYTGLSNERAAHVEINHWIRLSLGLADPVRCDGSRQLTYSLIWMSFHLL